MREWDDCVVQQEGECVRVVVSRFCHELWEQDVHTYNKKKIRSLELFFNYLPISFPFLCAIEKNFKPISATRTTLVVPA